MKNVLIIDMENYKRRDAITFFPLENEINVIADTGESYTMTKNLSYTIEVNYSGRQIAIQDVLDIEDILNRFKTKYPLLDFIISGGAQHIMYDHLHLLIFGDSHIAFQYSAKVRREIKQSLKHLSVETKFMDIETACSYLNHCNLKDHDCLHSKDRSRSDYRDNSNPSNKRG